MQASVNNNLLHTWARVWLIEGEDERDHGGHLEDDQGHVLQRVAHQLQGDDGHEVDRY